MSKILMSGREKEIGTESNIYRERKIKRGDDKRQREGQTGTEKERERVRDTDRETES